MSFKDLTVEQVRKELADIVARYPDNTGGDPDTYQQKACVYFKDATGYPVSYTEENYGITPDVSSLVTPVCIVGRWVEDFHPELKEDETFQFVLLRNAVFSTSTEAARIFDEEVFDLLADVQGQQDNPETTWRDLSF